MISEIKRKLWIARDSDVFHGTLTMFNAKPIKKEGYYDTYTGSMDINLYWFNELAFEDGPKEVMLVPNTGPMMDNNYVWIARDNVNGDNLYIYTNYPLYDEGEFKNAFKTGFLSLDPEDFPEIKRGYAPVQYEIIIKDNM